MSEKGAFDEKREKERKKKMATITCLDWLEVGANRLKKERKKKKRERERKL